MNKLLVLLILPVSLLSSPCPAQTYYSYAFGKQYAFKITTEMLAKSPSWPENSDNPPLPARKAIRLATALKDRLVKDSEAFKWHLVSAQLERNWGLKTDTGKWWWLINFEAHVRVGGQSGRPINLRVVVLMDGTVIEPTICDEEEEVDRDQNNR
jgi:hypothetical protein